MEVIKHLLLTLVVLLGFAPVGRAQFGRFIWQVNIGTANKREFGGQMIRLRHGGYVICGLHDTLSLVPALYLAKVSEQGIVQWQRAYTFNGFFGFDGATIAENRSGQLLVSGFGSDSTGNRASNDALLMLVDSSGQRIWKQEYHSPLYEAFSSIHLDYDGNFVFLALTLSQQSIWRMDSTGRVIQSAPSPNGGMYPLVPIQGGYVGAVSSMTPFPGYSQLVFLDDQFAEVSRGDTLPSITYGQLIKDTQGDYLLVRSSRLSKLSAQGDSLWNKLFGRSGSYVGVQSVAETLDNSYIVLGEQSFSFQGDLVLLEVARDGTVLRDTTLLRFAGDDYAGDIVLDAQGNYVVYGWTNAGVIGGTGTYDMFMFKMRPFRTLGVAAALASTDNITLYPNPATDVVRLHGASPLNGELWLRDLTGRVVRRQPCAAATTDAALPLTGLAPGVYVLTLNSNNNKLPHSWRIVKQ